MENAQSDKDNARRNEPNQFYRRHCETCNKKIEFIEKYREKAAFSIYLQFAWMEKECLMLYGSCHVQGNALFMDYSISKRQMSDRM